MSVLNSLKRLFPSGKSFRNIKDNLLAIVGGCADAIEDVKTFLKKVLTNFLPDTADDMIDEWLETLNVWKSENLSLIEKQKKAAGRYQSLVGGQDITYLQAIIDTAYSGSVTIQEVLPPDGTYNVVGTVANTEDFIRLKGIIE
ncbi:MAG: DUF2313 domain-containing protein, partial [Aliifodinibius sp.]|nr:DUF2313 domain-containing protein [Fodinibius sp.]